jgi:hypothetical protein
MPIGIFLKSRTQKEPDMSRFDNLAARLLAVEAKLAALTGTAINTEPAVSIDELDTRLTLVEVTIDQLVAEKTQEHIEAIVSAPADEAPVAVETVVALSPSADVPEAAAVVEDVIIAQQEADAVEDTEVAEIVAAAVAAVVQADPEVVADPEAITAAIIEAVADIPAPAPEVAEQAADAVAEIVAVATGNDEVSPEIKQEIADAVATPADPELDAVEDRLVAVETKVDSLLGK